LRRFFQPDHGSDLLEGAEMQTSRKVVDVLAKAVQAEVESQVQELTLAELVRAYDRASCSGEEFRLRKWVNAFGEISAWAITRENLSAGVLVLVEELGYSPATANRDLSALGSVYRWAIDRRICPRGFVSPTLNAKRFTEQPRKIFATDDEVRALRDLSHSYKDRRFAVFVNLLLDTGARAGELRNLRWGHVDLDLMEILLMTSKTGFPRTLHFSEVTRHLIMRVYPQRQPDALVFEGRVPGRPINYRASWKKLKSEIGRPEIHLHDGRHFSAAKMISNGVPIAVVAQALGNSAFVVSRRYGHLETKSLREPVSSLWTTNPR
jgi:integrase